MRFSTGIASLSCIFCLFVVGVRCFDGSYNAAGGKWGDLNTGDVQPMDHDPATQTTLGNLSGYSHDPLHIFTSQAVLFLFHFNAAKYFRELEFPRKGKYLHAVGAASLVAFILVALMMIFVYLTFGPRASVNTFDNYSTHDNLANSGRLFFSIGMMGCFPLLFAGMREALVEGLSLYVPSQSELFSTVVFQNAFSLCLLALVTGVTCAGRRLDMRLNNIGRSVFGSLLIYVIPPFVYVLTNWKYMRLTGISKVQMVAMVLMGIFGLGLAAMSFVVWCTSWSESGWLESRNPTTGRLRSPGVSLPHVSHTRV
jgi:hypothetical protein